MIDFTWKIFSQTGNIETYLLFKELENEMNHHASSYYKDKNKEVVGDSRL